MKPPILVTGGAGYIGSHVVRQLGEAGYFPVTYDNASRGDPAQVLYGDFVQGDLSDRERLRQAFAHYRFAAVLHFAASTVAPESVEQPLAYYANNTANTLNLLSCCQEFGVRQFVFSSTAAVYGTPQTVPVDESAPLAPINPYGHSKRMSEQILRDCAVAWGLRFVILRYFNVAGADPVGRLGQPGAHALHLIDAACEAAAGKRAGVSIFGTDYPTRDGTGIRDYIHVEDLASAHLQALRYLQAGGPSETLNCGYGRGYTVREVLRTVKAVAGTDFPVYEAHRRPGDPAAVVAQADRIARVLDWQPQYDSLEAIVATALAKGQRLAAA